MTEGSSTWSTEEGGDYSPEKFYTRHTDGRGRSATVKATVPPEILAQIAQIIQQRKIPHYKTYSDFVADAVHHRLQWLEDNTIHSPEFAAAMRVAAITSEAANASADIAQRQEMVNAVRELLASTQTIGDKSRLKELVYKYELEAEGLENPWRGELLGVLESYRNPDKGEPK